mmetsp:Transcript_105829/g.264989  ORF Transcript_105829/g.264989 Transcript_105829/m.264989 type:complete len:321 (-) Transcript_105829:388-1350(-)
MTSFKKRGAAHQLRLSKHTSKPEQLARASIPSSSSSSSSSTGSSACGADRRPHIAAQQAAAKPPLLRRGRPDPGEESAARAAAACGPLSSQHMSATAAAVTCPLPAQSPRAADVDNTHAGGGNGHAAPVAPTPLGVPPLVLHDSDEKVKPSVLPLPSRARHAQRACGPEQYTSQKGTEVPLAASNLCATPTMSAVSRCAATPLPVAGVARLAMSSSSPAWEAQEAPPTVLPGDLDNPGEDATAVGLFLGVRSEAPAEGCPPPSTTPPPWGTKSKAKKKPGARSSVAAAAAAAAAEEGGGDVAGPVEGEAAGGPTSRRANR